MDMVMYLWMLVSVLVTSHGVFSAALGRRRGMMYVLDIAQVVVKCSSVQG